MKTKQMKTNGELKDLKKLSKDQIIEMFQNRIALMQTRKVDRDSEFFIKKDKTTIFKVNNLPSTPKYFELHYPEFMRATFKERVTCEEFNMKIGQLLTT